MLPEDAGVLLVQADGVLDGDRLPVVVGGVTILFAAFFVVVFGFLFVTVAGRISGLLGNSSNPISGMSIATLMATCAIFFLAGWTSANYAVLALMIGGVVCIAAAIAGATSQDLKTGYLVGATPFWQQMGLLVGVTVSTVAIISVSSRCFCRLKNSTTAITWLRSSGTISDWCCACARSA